MFNPVNEITEITNTVGTPWPQPTYDPAGNMTTIPWTKPGAARGGWSGLTTDDWSTLSLDDWSGLPVSSADSEPTSSFAATYDAWNRLVTLTDADTDAPVQHNHYDARMFRVLRDEYADGTQSESRRFFYTAGWRCVEERLDSIASSSSLVDWVDQRDNPASAAIDNHKIRTTGFDLSCWVSRTQPSLRD